MLGPRVLNPIQCGWQTLLDRWLTSPLPISSINKDILFTPEIDILVGNNSNITTCIHVSANLNFMCIRYNADTEYHQNIFSNQFVIDIR